MKKVKYIISLLCVLTMVISTDIRAEEKNIVEIINDIMLVSDEIAKEKVIKGNDELIESYIETSYEFWRSVKQESKAVAYEERARCDQVIMPEKTFSFYLMSTEKYLKQYSNSNNFEYLIDNTKYWYPIYVKDYSDRRCFYDSTGNNTEWSKYIADDKTIDFLLNPEEIERIVEEGTDETIIDAKIISIPLTTILYLKGEQTDYGIIIYDWHGHENDDVYLERYKLYKMSNILNSCGLYETLPIPEILETKPTYETEAEALKVAGILTGTDKGLELLKPLSRIEATTILVRILGLENEPTSDVSYFTDIPSDNWGAKYANIAADKNIAAGVGDGLFAPNDTITASQFATLLLRSNGENPDWQTAINLLVEREYLTQEQADKMDLFTRGDMAKIIYEARERNLF